MRNRRGNKNNHWKGGRTHASKGYIYVWNPTHPHATKAGYVLEHRLAMEEYLGHCLEPWERVHHKNGIKDDNRIENLELYPNDAAHNASQALLEEKNKWKGAFSVLFVAWVGTT